MSSQSDGKFRLLGMLSEKSKSHFNVRSDQIVFRDLLSVQFSRVFNFMSELESWIKRNNLKTSSPESCLFVFGKSPLLDPSQGGQLVQIIFSQLLKSYEYNVQCSFLCIHMERWFDMFEPFKPLKSSKMLSKKYVDRANFKKMFRETYENFNKLNDENRGGSLENGVQIITFYINSRLQKKPRKIHLVNVFDVVSLREYHSNFSFENSFNLSFGVSSLEMMDNEDKNSITSNNARALEGLLSCCRFAKESARGSHKRTKGSPSARDTKISFFLGKSLRNATFLVHFNESSYESSFQLLKFAQTLSDLNKPSKLLGRCKRQVIELKEKNIQLQRENNELKQVGRDLNERLLSNQRDLELMKSMLKDREREKNKYMQENLQMMRALNELKENEGCLELLKRIVVVIKMREVEMSKIAKEGKNFSDNEIENIIKMFQEVGINIDI